MDDQSPTTARHCYQLTCCLSVRPIDCSRGKPTTCRNGSILLGRNQMRQIVVRVSLLNQSLSYLLTDVRVHHRFAKEGKGCIQIPAKNIQIMLSNCPPDRINVFLKTLDAKLILAKKDSECSTKTPRTATEKLLAGIPEIHDELSPLSLVEIKRLGGKLRETTNTVHSKRSPITPKSRTNKAPATTPKATKRSFDSVTKSQSTPKLERQTSSESVTLSEEQKRVVRAVMAGKNVFFTGEAGTGKSLLIRKLVGSLPADTTFVTAATGVAACQIGGITLHSFAGIGTGCAPIERCVEMANRPAIASIWRKCKHLIIDEISMVDADFFTKLEKVARFIRRNDQPFGGIQLIICGDFLQLPPVSKSTSVPKKFCFESEAWRRCIENNIVLREVRRQNDMDFVRILKRIRLGRCSASDCEVLKNTRRNMLETDAIVATRLCTHKADAEMINTKELEKLTGDVKVFSAHDSESVPSSNEYSCLSEIKLKIGAQVLLNKNLDLSRSLSNGSRGVVTAFKNGYPVVRFASGVTETMKPARFHLRMLGSQTKFIRTQVPLQLAWAISIHKSQGMTLDRVQMSLGRVFEDGQAYVALSRARCLQGLRILDFDVSCVRANTRVLEFYDQLSSDDQIEMERPFKRQKLLQQFR